MNVAIIIAGGVGSRTGNRIPKQFINVNDKPIIIYTLEQFQKHKNIDAIEVVCLDGWHDILRAYAEQYGIAKLRYIISGGTSSQESIKIGLENLKGKLNKDDVVVIHDGIRPMVDADIISSCIDMWKKAMGCQHSQYMSRYSRRMMTRQLINIYQEKSLELFRHHRHIDMAEY